MNDEDLCMLLLYAKRELRSNNDYPYIGIRDLAPFFNRYGGREFKKLIFFLRSLNLSIKETVIYGDIDEKELFLPPSADSMAHLTTAEQTKVQKAATRILDDDFSQKEIDILIPFTSAFLDNVCFAEKISEADSKFITEWLNEYIQYYIDGELSISDRNALIFEKQKERFFEHILTKKLVEKYGNTFITEYKFSQKDDFYFIHTLVAMEKLGYISLNKISFIHNPILEIAEYSVNLKLEPVFINEMNQKYKKDNPNHVYEDYDTEHCVITFLGKKIEISKTKSSDPARLMSTLAKDPSKKWNKDEVYDDLGYSIEEQKGLPSQKMYQAALKISDIVTKKTQVDDFLIFSTKSTQINPKYMAE